jgi:hypothetical protein
MIVIILEEAFLQKYVRPNCYENKYFEVINFVKQNLKEKNMFSIKNHVVVRNIR